METISWCMTLCYEAANVTKVIPAFWQDSVGSELTTAEYTFLFANVHHCFLHSEKCSLPFKLPVCWDEQNGFSFLCFFLKQHGVRVVLLEHNFCTLQEGLWQSKCIVTRSSFKFLAGFCCVSTGIMISIPVLLELCMFILSLQNKFSMMANKQCHKNHSLFIIANLEFICIKLIFQQFNFICKHFDFIALSLKILTFALTCCVLLLITASQLAKMLYK